jgi:hypothetical protein
LEGNVSFELLTICN